MDIFGDQEEFELAVLRVISAQGWIREFELALILKIMPSQLKWIITELEKQKWILRLKIQHDAGYFCQLTKRGARKVGGVAGNKLDVPITWRHDCLAIQAGMYLSEKFGKEFTSNAELIKKYANKSVKMTDGEVGDDIFLEQEHARKTGKKMRRQTECIINSVKKGKTCIVSYPIPC